MPDDAELFSSQAVGPTRQYGWWRDAVNATHLAWDMPARRDATFRGRIRRQRVGAAEVIDCLCDGCDGRRGPAEIARSGDAWYGVLHVLGGRERLVIGADEIELEAGSFAVWDSTRAIRFATPDTLRKLTLMLPQHMAPGLARLVGRRIDARRGPGALFATHLRALSRQAAGLDVRGQSAVLRPTLDLLELALDPLPGGPGHGRAVMARATAHILRHLADPGLRPEGVAAAVGLSLRQLHRIFADSDWTVERWIWHQRLQRCAQDLRCDPAARITEIAFRWGFSDAAHFSRVFRAGFGQSPRDYRRGGHGR
ncbi:MAG: helix-turn-helix domain-containing protein [Alphaproteobacteria bacterium]|nr:helix-turn-helix domain-containing protein [Alphaproteobacteria bacterium]